MKVAPRLGTFHRQIWASQQIREEDRAACAAEILVRRNLTIWNAAIYCTLVVRDSLIVSLR